MTTLSAFHAGLQGQVATQVISGAELLDAKDPGWTERIEVPMLDISDCFTCVLGQDFYDRWLEQNKDRLPDSTNTPFKFGTVALGVSNRDNYLYGFDVNSYSDQDGEEHEGWWDISDIALTEEWAEYLRLRREAGL